MNKDGTRASAVDGAAALNVPDSSGWRLVATGTFEHTVPSYSDLVWHNGATGATQVWFMGANLTRNSFASLDASLNVADSSGWGIVGADDFDFDGYDDLVWHNGATGQTQIWYMNGVTRLGVANLDPSLNVADSSGWRIAAVADMNALIRPDIIWHNGATGETQIWYMSGGTRGSVPRSSVDTLPADLNLADSTGWHIVRP